MHLRLRMSAYPDWGLSSYFNREQEDLLLLVWRTTIRLLSDGLCTSNDLYFVRDFWFQEWISRFLVWFPDFLLISTWFLRADFYDDFVISIVISLWFHAFSSDFCLISAASSDACFYHVYQHGTLRALLQVQTIIYSIKSQCLWIISQLARTRAWHQ